MAGELVPTLGDIRPHGHLKLGRFTQHFVDVLNLEMTPLDFFQQKYPDDPFEEQRKYLGRFGVSGKMQVQKMAELSDGQKSRVVFAHLGRLRWVDSFDGCASGSNIELLNFVLRSDRPHILLLDEPTNSLDPESIDALAKAVNEFEGGMVLVSHDMRLISQVAKEIWICDNKTIIPYKGDINSFKLDMRKQMGLDDGKQGSKTLRGDFSEKVKDVVEVKAKQEPKPKVKVEIAPPTKQPSNPLAESPKAPKPPVKPVVEEDGTTITTSTTIQSSGTISSVGSSSNNPAAARAKYVPPHLRKKMQQSS